MQISEAAGGQPAPGAEPCRFPKLEECAHFHYERVRLPPLSVTLRTNMDQSYHSQHTNEENDAEWYMIQVTSGEECWLLQRNFDNFKMLDAQVHQCIYDRKISQLPDLSVLSAEAADIEKIFIGYLQRFSQIADNSLNCGPVLNWLQMDNKGHRLLVPSEESRSINTPAVAAAYSVRRYVSQARDELNLEVGDMISVIDMANPGESMWWRGKRGFQVGFFPQHCVHIIGDKVPRNMPLPPPVVGSLAITSIKPVLRKHGKLITFFRSFILNRPSRRRLKQSGILKERVFACDLGEHLLNSGHEIPMVLKCCAEFIEKNGIVDGIYRLSGITSNIQKLRNAFDEDRIPNLYTEEILQDIHSVASLLKMYFRELPNPLCTYQLYQSFVNAFQNTGAKGTEGIHERLLKMREAVQKLPPPHYRTLEYLMKHLAKVAKHSASTGMTTRNVAIVWAPNLLRCAELEDGGVTALQGVGVQAVVTEFLICYADLIFCDHLPNLCKPLLESSSTPPKKCRPKSLAISSPAKLITLEEARSKHLLNNRTEECNYIEVGGGPKNLPKKYHTIIELPSGTRKRGHAKRSPLGWRSFFTKSKSTPQTNLKVSRKSSTTLSTDKFITVEPEMLEVKRILRSVKSAESLTSGHSELGHKDQDVVGPIYSLHKPPGHNRSISHDSYFDMVQNSQNNSEGSLLDISEIQLNFDLEETEMKIFSEDESLVSSPRIQKEMSQRRILTRARPEEFGSASNSGNPSPKKQARVVISPDSMSRKRTRLEDQLSDMQYIDCSTPDNTVCITAVIHSEDAATPANDIYQPKNKSPRSSQNLDKRQSPNLGSNIPDLGTIKSFTDNDIIQNDFIGPGDITPQSPLYRPLGDSSTNTTSNSSPNEINYEELDKAIQNMEYANVAENFKPNLPIHENILTTISITYKSPPRSIESSPLKTQTNEYDSLYGNVSSIPEKAVIPTSSASLPIQQASQPEIDQSENYFISQLTNNEERPKSLSALDTFQQRDDKIRVNLSSSAIYDTNEQLSLFSADELKTFSSSHSSGSNVQFTPSSNCTPYHFIENGQTPTDLSLSEVFHNSSDNLTASHTSLSFPISSKSITPNVSATALKSNTHSLNDLLTPTSFLETRNTSECSLLQDMQSEVTEDSKLKLEVEYKPVSANLINLSPSMEADTSLTKDSNESSLEKEKSLDNDVASSTNGDEDIYQQVKYFRHSIQEVNTLLKIESSDNNENVQHYPESTLINSEKIEEFPERIENPASGEKDDIDLPSDIVTDDVENYDSLEPQDTDHVYENVMGEEMKNNYFSNIYENVELRQKSPEDQRNLSTTLDDRLSVKDLLVKFEESGDTKVKTTNDVVIDKNNINMQESVTNPRFKKIYGKDSLPPCLRARNLKNQIKTRSLDEEEFKKEFSLIPGFRRKSVDEFIAYKTNSLPKLLNQPKVLPSDGSEREIDSLHLSHSSENIARNVEEEKKRERIEKYKEERRKFLQEKYRTESFKEDKDVLLSRMKFSKSCSKEDSFENIHIYPSLTRIRRKSTRSEESVSIEDEKPLKTPEEERHNRSQGNIAFIPKSSSLKARAAVFERNSADPISILPKTCKKNNFKEQTEDSTIDVTKNNDEIFADTVVLRNKIEEIYKNERRRHTCDSRERDFDTERRSRSGSFGNQSQRKERTASSYCIKDMKAIFESKSKQ